MLACQRSQFLVIFGLIFHPCYILLFGLEFDATMNLVVMRRKSSTIPTQVYVFAFDASISVTVDVPPAKRVTSRISTERSSTMVGMDFGRKGNIRQWLIGGLERMVWVGLFSAQYTRRAEIPLWAVHTLVPYTKGSLRCLSRIGHATRWKEKIPCCIHRKVEIAKAPES